MSAKKTKDERIARSERWELVRAALRSSAAHGFYVFDELITEEAGMIDFLAIGPSGACVIVVRDEEGEVTADEYGTLYLNHRRFKDDPRDQASELCDDVDAKLGSGLKRIQNIICFTRADLFYLGDDQDVLKGISPVWDLSLAFANATEECSIGEVYEMASQIRKVYGRPPFVRPAKGDA